MEVLYIILKENAIAKGNQCYSFWNYKHEMIVHLRVNNNITNPDFFFSRRDSFDNLYTTKVAIITEDSLI